MIVADGNETLREVFLEHRVEILPIILKASYWVHPDIFKALPVWYPEFWRTAPLFKSDWSTRQLNNGEPKDEGNGQASITLKKALNLSGELDNEWTCCHIWGTHGFQNSNEIIRDSRFYSCVANMTLLPTPLKAFTDSDINIKFALRVLAFHLYDWVCDHEQAKDHSLLIRNGETPDGYPDGWPHPRKKSLPPNICPTTATVLNRISKRKQDIKNLLSDSSKVHYPREKVIRSLDYWGIEL